MWVTMKINNGGSSSKWKLSCSIPAPEGAARAADRTWKCWRQIYTSATKSGLERSPGANGGSVRAGSEPGLQTLTLCSRNPATQIPSLTWVSWWWCPPRPGCCVSRLRRGEERGRPLGRTCHPFVQYLGLLHLKYRRKQEKKDLN